MLFVYNNILNNLNILKKQFKGLIKNNLKV